MCSRLATYGVFAPRDFRIAALYIVILATDFAAVLSISADINNDIY